MLENVNLFMIEWPGIYAKLSYFQISTFLLILKSTDRNALT